MPSATTRPAARSLRSPLSIRRCHTAPAAISTATTAAAICRADTLGLYGSARRRSAQARDEGARGAQAGDHHGQLGSQRERRRLEVVLEGRLPARRVGLDGRSDRLDVELLAIALHAVQLGVDVRSREALG